MLNKESSYQNIAELIERFEDQYESYSRSDYNEALTRQDFIDPFFESLGWDMSNKNGYAEAYREVIHEDKLKISGATKAPDYSFRLPGGKRLFFVEAKKPNVAVKDEIMPAYQIRRYGWSAKMPISIITDFQEFAVYDCTKKPNLTDKASVARIRYLTYKDYLKEFDFIYDNFSKERVLKGSFDKFVEGNAFKKGTTTVDKEFLKSLDNWRTYLATSISWNNKNLDEDEINFAVQQTIDRIIFLRIAEDRNVEEYGKLKEAIKQGNFYENLYQQFITADARYNSGLFDLGKDQISRNLVVENKIIKNVISDLYYPQSPYEFSVLSVEILGSAYEQFLGKQIRIDAAHRAKIEEKPEVRKAGGVYYTPQYIVDYIVKNTVGKLIEISPSLSGRAGVGLTPKDISKIKIVDPACGSGSFLLGAYQYLLDYHKQYYKPVFEELNQKAADSKLISKERNSAIKERNKLPLTPTGELTTRLKKEILINNIFGVDIDLNAVEVTKLSLLLKCMEGETNATIQALSFNERILPSLEKNIQSGNSLIDTDYYSNELDFGEEKKIKPFSWQKAFPEVFKQGGFDAVIGNPPYVRQELLGKQKEYFQRRYKAFHGVADLYTYFIEKGISLLNEKGRFGFIVANKWMRANYGEPLRKWLKDQNIEEIIDFGDLPVFKAATTYPCILICTNEKANGSLQVTNVKTLKFDTLQNFIAENRTILSTDSLEDSGWNLGSDAEQRLLKKIQHAGVPLGDYVGGKIFRGVLTGLNEAFVIDEATKNRLIAEDRKSEEIIKPFLAGRDIKRYAAPRSNKYLIFTRRGIDIENYPAIKNHLLQFKKQLMPKPKVFKGDKWPGRKSGSYKWYEMQDAIDYYEEFEKPKILWPGISSVLTAFAFDYNKYYGNDNNQLIISNDTYLLGILNSNLSKFQLLNICDRVQGGFYRLKIIYVAKLVIKNIDFRNEFEKYFHDDIAKNVHQLLKLNEEKQQSKLQSKTDQLQSRIDYHEARINEIVYKLYGLTEEEKKLVEGK